MIIPTSDAPAWVQRIVRHKTIKVYETPNAAIHGNWHDWNCRTIYLYDGSRVSAHSDTGYENAINDPAQLNRGMPERPWPSPDAAILIVNSHPAIAELYVPHWHGPKALPEALTAIDRIILAIYRSYIPRARPDYLRRARVTKADIDSLIARGFITPRNALTLRGKQAAEGLPDPALPL